MSPKRQAEFRAQVRDFIRREAPERDPSGSMMGRGPAWKTWVRKLAAQKWIAPAWSAEYGGAGLSVMEQFIFNSEMAEARAPRPGGIATGFAGPTLIIHGTESQKLKRLPEILESEVIWYRATASPEPAPI